MSILNIIYLIISVTSIVFCLGVAIGGLISFFESVNRMKSSISTFDRCLSNHMTQLNMINIDLNNINEILKTNKPIGEK